MAEVSLNDIYHRLGGIQADVAALKLEAGKQSDLAREAADEASRKRAEMYKSMEGLHDEVRDLGGQVKAVDARVTRMEPGWEEHQRMRQQAEGAGKLGRGLYWLGGWIIAAAAAIASALQWITGWPKPPG